MPLEVCECVCGKSELKCDTRQLRMYAIKKFSEIVFALLCIISLQFYIIYTFRENFFIKLFICVLLCLCHPSPPPIVLKQEINGVVINIRKPPSRFCLKTLQFREEKRDADKKPKPKKFFKKCSWKMYENASRCTCQ